MGDSTNLQEKLNFFIQRSYLNDLAHQIFELVHIDESEPRYIE